MEPVAIVVLIVGVVVLVGIVAIATFPAALMAGPMGFAKRAFFEAEPTVAQAPVIELR